MRSPRSAIPRAPYGSSPARRVVRSAALIAAGTFWILLAMTVVQRSWTRLAPSDWTAFAVGGRLAVTRPAEMYQRAAQLSQQLQLVHVLFGRSVTGAVHGVLPVIAPPWVNLLASPFTALGYTTGGRAWVLVQLLALPAAGLLVTGLREAPRALIALAGMPAVVTIDNSQVDGLVVLGGALAWRLYSRGNQFWAGVALTLTLAKPHLVLGIAAGLVATRRWRMLAGWTAGGLSLVAASTAVDPHLVPTWIGYAFGHAGQVGYEMGFGGLADLVVGGSAGSVVAAVIGIGITLWLARGREIGQAAALLLLGGLLAAPHALPTDLVLAPLALLIAGRDGIVRLVAVSAGTFVVNATLDVTGFGLEGRIVTAVAGSVFLLLLMVDVARPMGVNSVGAFRAWRSTHCRPGAARVEPDPSTAAVLIAATEARPDR